MDNKELYELISRFEKSTLSKIEIEKDEDGFKIKLEKQQSQPVVVERLPQAMSTTVVSEIKDVLEEQHDKAKEEESLYQRVTSPIVGVFYQAPNPEAEPFVKLGDKVSEGQVLCLIEAMKMMNELKSPVDGIIKGIHVENAGIVEFGQLIYEVEPC